jgi:hypothetical protein
VKLKVNRDERNRSYPSWSMRKSDWSEGREDDVGNLLRLRKDEFVRDG